MPYISKEEIKEKRNLIRKSFPSKDGWKISITRRNYSVIDVKILNGPIELISSERAWNNGRYESVNHFYITEHYKDEPEKLKVLTKIYNIINKNNGELVYDGDYGSVPNFYTSISIGDWDKPYEVKTKK